MHNKFAYQGTVTLVTRINNQIISKKYYNNGTEYLFEAYARAISNQPINSFIPTKLDIGINGSTFTSKLRNKLDVVVNYQAKDTDGGDYGVSYTRISVVITKDAFLSTSDADVLTLRLESSTGVPLAHVLMDADFNNTIKSMSQGVQLILLWDLYITNKEEN